MANLILKPTSGGSLILQDEGGTAAHTIDASGNHTLSGNITSPTLVTPTIASMANCTFPSGHTLQVVQSVKQDGFSHAGQAETLVTGYNCSITPTKAGSKILVYYSFDSSTNTSITARAYMERKIGSAAWAKLTAAMGTETGSGMNTASISHAGGENNWEMHKRAGQFLDTPTYTLTNAVQYRIGIQNESASNTIYIGKTGRNNTAYHPVTASILILTEVAG